MPLKTKAMNGLRLPVVPVKGKVAFPFIPFNHDLINQFSINAFNLAAQSDNTLFLAFSEKNDLLPPSQEELYEVGVIARIDNSFTSEDGSIRVAFKGICRGRAASFDTENSTFIADVVPEEYRPEALPKPVEEKALRRYMLRSLAKLIKLLPPDNSGVLSTAESIKNIGNLADYIAYSSFANLGDKLRVLSEYEPLKRAAVVCSVLESDFKIYSEELYIHQRIQHSMEETQYDNYLREKLKVIKEELGEDGDDADEYTSKIESLTFSSDRETSDKIKEKLLKEVSRLCKMPFGSAEAAVIKGYLDTCLELPWSVSTVDCIDVEKAKAILNADHDGLEKPKERIVEYLAVKQLNPKIKNQILCFVGPPGVGKTSLGMSIARAMGRKFARVSLGGIHDEAEIRGHRKTYIGSMPGRIIAAIQ